jgi:D-serine deaminase-like pyridoxal phosphate-dependent protein
MHLNDLPTPSLLLDRQVLIRNLEAMGARMSDHGVGLRPHIKTAKSARVAELAHGGAKGPLTVSTLKEAEYFFDHGFSDLTYAVGMAPAKLERAPS